MNYRHPTPPADAVAGKIHRTKEGRNRVSFVPLSTGGFCKVSTADLDRLQAFGIPCADWFVTDHQGAPSVVAPSKNLSRLAVAVVGELIYGLGHFDRLSFRNCDPFDLSRPNVTRWHDRESRLAFMATNAEREEVAA